MKVLAADAFERWLVHHVTRCFPEYARSLGTDELIAAIRRKRLRAARYFKSEAGICAFIDFTFLFGETFDDDPRLPWAREILLEPSLDDAQRRRKLYNRGRAYLLRARARKVGLKRA